MAYKNASELLPADLLRAVQEYIDGDALYIPAKSKRRKSWGTRNGIKAHYEKRNEEIRRLYTLGVPADEIASRYCLSRDSIRKIIKG